MTTTLGAGHDASRRRLFALAALLVVSLALAAALAWYAIQTARRHRATAERVLGDYAGFGASILANQIYWQLGNDVLRAFATLPWGAERVPESSLPSGAGCDLAPLYFEGQFGNPLVTVVGGPLSPLTRAFLEDTLRHALPLLQEVDWRFRFIRAPAGAGADGFFITSEMSRGLRGFGVCLAGKESPVGRAARSQHALPPALTGALAADSLYAVRLVSGDGRPLYASAVSYQSPFVGASRLGPEFGDLTVELILREGLADRLVIGGLPSSPTPLALGLLGVSAVLIVATLLLLRREYELIAIRSTFVSSVSHELRTPLSQILLFAELLKLGRVRTEAERTRALEIIDHETRRLIRLVENVLQFSRSGTVGERLSRETLLLRDVVDETIDAFRPLAEARGAALVADVPAPLAVRGDRGALRQVLLNLLDNAVKYGPRGQTVRILARGNGTRVSLAVEDQGPGIPDADRERVWDDFFRLPRDRESAVGGSGIGLAVVRSLAERMGGAVRTETAAGSGARMVVELPLAETAS